MCPNNIFSLRLSQLTSMLSTGDWADQGGHERIHSHLAAPLLDWMAFILPISCEAMVFKCSPFSTQSSLLFFVFFFFFFWSCLRSFTAVPSASLLAACRQNPSLVFDKDLDSHTLPLGPAVRSEGILLGRYSFRKVSFRCLLWGSTLFSYFMIIQPKFIRIASLRGAFFFLFFFFLCVSFCMFT
jgi:hypothetical protein